MNEYLLIAFKHIEKFYTENRKQLLENDDLRPCKSITRDVGATIDKFKEYYLSHDSKGELTYQEIMTDLLGFNSFNDVVTTNIRVMREYGLLQNIDQNNFKFTEEFFSFVEKGISGNDFVWSSLQKVKNLQTINMVNNTVICALREGYIYGRIIAFPESVEEFKQVVPEQEKRLQYCERVYAIYGFRGRNKAVNSDAYTPNSSYRIVTLLRALNLINPVERIGNLKAHTLTEKAIDFLVKLNQRLGNELEAPLNRNFYGMHITHKNTAVKNGEISIGWSTLGDLAGIDTKDKLSDLMDVAFPDKKPRSKAQDLSQIWTFRGEMSVGDYVVFSDGRQAHIGVIKSDYYYEVNEETRDADYVNNRKVEWLKSIDRDKLPKMFRSALAATRSVFSLNAYKSIILELLEKDVLDYDEEEVEEEIEEVEPMEEQRPYIELNFTTNIECDYERNRIVFGAPGTGKSFQMEEDRKTVLATLGGGYERVTFHPDYTYSSFVGCYKPVSEKGKIEYKYVPGPFMRVLVQALRSGLKDEVAKPYLLVIEEINRAKVAAVFGEVFQLLDRDENGTSDYEINASEDVKQYLSDELGGSLESFDKIRIPNNMFIWASMNSADQGVFPMDTAFKRRWSFEYKGIDENEDKVGGKIVLGKGEYELEVDWNDLRKAINDVLARTFKINEDKLMGPFFIGEDVFAFDKETKMINNPEKFKKVFKSKVIMYLFEDAAKQHKHKLFSGCDATTYSAICNKFDEIGIDIFGADFRTTYFAK